MSRRPRIGVSACIMEQDKSRTVFNGRPLLYWEESLAHYLQRQGALVYLIPTWADSSQAPTVEDLCAPLDGLVLHGGVDVSPGCYGEKAQREDWGGNPRRDAYEIALLRAFFAEKKPILGVCRGMQLINVSFGGSLHQDIKTDKPAALIHRDADIYEKNQHWIDIVEGSTLAQLYPQKKGKVNSVHHQGVKKLAPGFVVEARSSEDGVIEAIRYEKSDHPFCYGVQWHPEFQDPSDSTLLDPEGILGHFMKVLRERPLC